MHKSNRGLFPNFRVLCWSEQSSTEQVTLSSSVTLFSRYPGYFPHFCLALVIGLIFILYLPSALTGRSEKNPHFSNNER
jgi:hypothetical protein